MTPDLPQTRPVSPDLPRRQPGSPAAFQQPVCNFLAGSLLFLSGTHLSPPLSSPNSHQLFTFLSGFEAGAYLRKGSVSQGSQIARGLL